MKQSKQISPSLTSGRCSHSPLHALKRKKITAFIQLCNYSRVLSSCIILNIRGLHNLLTVAFSKNSVLVKPRDFERVSGSFIIADN